MRVSFLRLIDQFDGTHRFLEELKTVFRSADYSHLQFSVAFAKFGPLLRLSPLLKHWRQQGKTVEAIFGIDLLECVQNLGNVRFWCGVSKYDHTQPFPPYTLVSSYYHAWRKSGLGERLHEALRTRVRKQEGRDVEPSVLMVDSQSSKTTEKGGQRTLRKLSATTPASTSKAANATLG